MASKLSFTIAVCSCATLAKVNAIFADVGNLDSRRMKRTKTVLRIPAMQFVAENKMRTAILAKSSRPGKTIEVRIGNKTIHFGASGYEDYTTHKDPVRKASYLSRHRNENWNDPETAGFWARWILWNKKTIGASIRDLRRLGIAVSF